MLSLAIDIPLNALVAELADLFMRIMRTRQDDSGGNDQ